MIFGVIVAGGVGMRLGADRPKQFLDLNAGSSIRFTWACIRNGWNTWWIWLEHM